MCFVEQRAASCAPARRHPRAPGARPRKDGLIVACDDARAAEETLDVPALGLRDYQSAAVEKLAKVTQGTVVIPCGGGKTRVGMGAIARLRTPTLILVPPRPRRAVARGS